MKKYKCRGKAGDGSGHSYDGWFVREDEAQAEIDRLKRDLAEAYMELCQQRPTIGAVFNRAVWDKAEEKE